MPYDALLDLSEGDVQKAMAMLRDDTLPIHWRWVALCLK